MYSGVRQCGHPRRGAVGTEPREKQHQLEEEESQQQQVEVCRLTAVSSTQWSVECEEPPRCSRAAGYKLGMSASSPEGGLEWESFASVKTLAFYLRSLLDKTGRKHHEGFVILRCDTDTGAAASQILVLPPRSLGEKTAQPHVNLNLVLARGLSRAAVYRELEAAVAVMTSLNTRPSSRTEVLDFTLVQDLGGDRNLAALLTGGPSLRAAATLLTSFSGAGHRVTWQGPGCGNTSDLSRLSPRPRVSGLGVSTALCHVAAPRPVQVATLLAASSLLVTSLSAQHRAHLSVTSLPEAGLDNATDSALSRHLEAAASLPNTVTVLTSLSSTDPSQSLPLFLFVPHKVRALLPESAWRHLLGNQHSLVSLLDLHHSLLPLLNATRDPGPEATWHVGLMAPEAGAGTRQCAAMPRAQFACVCRPTVTMLGEDTAAAAAEILARLHNNLLAASADTVCARLRLEAVLQAEVSSYGPDDSHLQLQLVLALVTSDAEEDEVEDSRSVVSGTVDLDMASKTLELSTWSHDLAPQTFGCIQQYSSQEDIRREMVILVDKERQKAGVKVDSVFTENSVDCVWMVTRHHPGTGLVSLVMAAACQNPVEVTVRVTRDEASLGWRSGPRRLSLVCGEEELVAVIMAPLPSSRPPVWSYTVTDVTYVDSEDD